MADQTPAEAAVARGMALLDAKVPGWEERIDLAALRLQDCTLCICGQLFGRFSFGLDALKIDHAGKYGFFAPRGTTWTETENAWRSAITQRRQSRPVSPDVS